MEEKMNIRNKETSIYKRVNYILLDIIKAALRKKKHVTQLLAL